MLSDFLKDYLPIIVFLVISLGLSCAFVLLNFILSPKKPDPEKLSAYECGFDAFDDSRMEFDVRFYLVAILFIIFELWDPILACNATHTYIALHELYKESRARENDRETDKRKTGNRNRNKAN